jgi:hypothetical protein
MTNSESLINNNNVVIVPATKTDKNAVKEDVYAPPDGGFRAYFVMTCAFLCNGVIFGIINTYSVVYMSLQRQLVQSGDELASSKACE